MYDRGGLRADEGRPGRRLPAVYQRTAVVHTPAPETYRQLCRMLLRWDRSDIREEIRLWSIMWRLPFLALVLTLLETTITNLRYPVAYGSLALLSYLALSDPLTFARVMLSIGVVSRCTRSISSIAPSRGVLLRHLVRLWCGSSPLRS
ncbi:MAG TPA: hypothetical protein VFS39_10100 [Nitrospira sp.]|nr:hypothetical protein [Nitrospira sp.]